MEKYLIKKRKCAEEKEEEVAEDIIKSKRTCVEGTDGDVTVKPGESETSRPGHIVESEENEVRVESEYSCAGPSRKSDMTGLRSVKTMTGTSKSSRSKSFRMYNDSYLGLGFTCCDSENGPKPKCVVCGLELSNESMTPQKMKRHLSTKHRHLTQKPIDYFKRLLKENKQQSLGFEKKVKVAEKAQKASYLVAEQTVKQMKPHSIAESYFLPACCSVVKTLFGDEAEKEVKKIPLSNDTIGRRIKDMSSDIEKSVCELVKDKMFALQADESTDIGGKPQLLVFIRFIDDKKITEQFLCCKELSQTTGQEIFSTVTEYLVEMDLTWKLCVGICTDGCPSMVGSVKGFVSLVKKENPFLITTHCFLHREALVAKTLGQDLKFVLDNVVKMVNFIKSRPKQSRLFSSLCEEMGSAHEGLLLHTEVRWLSRGRVLSRVHELREEILLFFALEEKTEFCELLADEIWNAKLCYLADIFEHLNKVNVSMQGRNENMLTCTDKMQSMKEKIKVWKDRSSEGNIDMFQKTAAANNTDIVPLITDHLTSLERSIEKYFPNISTESYDWLRNPFVLDPLHKPQLSTHEEEELIDIRNDRTLRLQYMEMSLESFWIEMEKQYPHISKKAQKILLQFSTSYLCELGFSALTNIKTKKRCNLLSVEEEMRVCLSAVPPNIERICKSRQAQVSH